MTVAVGRNPRKREPNVPVASATDEKLIRDLFMRSLTRREMLLTPTVG
jgi:hypothetical protein